MSAAGVESVIRAVNDACRRDGRGYSCKRVSWDDVQRSGGGGALSSVGPNITDTRLYERSGRQLYVLRPDNWNEKLGKVDADRVAVVVGNHQAIFAEMTSVTLGDYLRKFGEYAGYAGVHGGANMFAEARDRQIGIRFQSVFLPASSHEAVEFAPEMYNYQTRSDADPKNLVVAFTTQGSSVQQDGAGPTRVYLHKRDKYGRTHRHWLEAERTRHGVGGEQKETAAERADAVARGKATASFLGPEAMGTRFNVLMTMQIPLRQRMAPARGMGWGYATTSSVTGSVDMLSFGSMPAAAAPPSAPSGGFAFGGGRGGHSGRGGRGRHSSERVVPSYAVRVSVGSEVDTWGGLTVTEPERDPSAPITLTVVVYYITPGGVPSVDDVKRCVDDMERLYAACDWSGRLAAAGPPFTVPGPAPVVPVQDPFAFPTPAPTNPELVPDWGAPVAQPAPPAPPSHPVFSSFSAADREAQKHLFTPAVRRDVFRILTGQVRGLRGVPRADGGTSRSSDSAWPSPHRFRRMSRVEAARRARIPWAVRAWRLVGAFGPTYFMSVCATSPGGGAVVEDAELLSLIPQIGQPTPTGIAFTEAFEEMLATELAPAWEEEDVEDLSDDFLTAFGNELTVRLDINARARTKALGADTVHRLVERGWVDRKVMEQYQ